MESLAKGSLNDVLTMGANDPAWAAPAATKEFFVPATGTTGGTLGYAGRLYAAVQLNVQAEKASMSFWIPNDYSSVTNAEIIVHVRATQAAASWHIDSNYAAPGEAYNASSESLEITYNVTNDEIYAIDISSILDTIAVGDIVGIQLDQKTAGHNVDVIGLRFRYS